MQKYFSERIFCMKKLLAIFLAALFVFSTATVFVSAASPKPLERDDRNVVMMDFLDFNAESNALWAEENEDGTWSNFIEFNNWEYPGNERDDGAQIAPYLRSSYSTNTQFSFIENGEVLHFEVTGSTDTPGLYFMLDELHDGTVPIGSDSGDNPKAEYVKIRVRNYSTANRFSFAFAANHTNSYRVINASICDGIVDASGKEYQSASGEWQTYIFSMPTINISTNYNEDLPDADSDGNPESRWGGNIDALVLFPFGYDVDDGTGPYVGAQIDIDYVVLGSLDYVTNYKSILEEKEESITSLELINEPTKQEYYVGETLDLDGLELKATYADGTTEILNSTSYTVNLETESASTPVTLTFGSQKAEFDVKVVGVSSIEVESAPEDTTYEAADVADGFTPTGYTFKVNYTDGTSRTDFPTTAFRCSAENIATAGTKTVTANFYGVKTTFDINVINVTDIELTANKTYRYNDKLSDSDFTIDFVYSDGSKISSDDASTELEYTFEVNAKSAGEVTAKVTATNSTYGINIVKEFNVTFDTPVNLSVATEPLKTTYQPGDTFDKTGLSVALVYADGKTVPLDDGDFTARANIANPGDVKVNIKCTVAGLEDLKLAEDYKVTVEGEVVNTTAGTTAANTTRAPQSSSSSAGISPVVIIIIIVAVVAVAGVVVVLVVLKKKKK